MIKLPNTYRFFVSPAAIQGDAVRLDDAELAQQLGKVLRLRTGNQVLFLDGLGNVYTVMLTELSRSSIAGHIVERNAASGEPELALTLYTALLRPERFEWVLQKGTELGVGAFVPLHCARSLPADGADERKLLRWRRIVREAAEQACRGRLPGVAAPLPFAAACAQAARADLALLLWEGEAQTLKVTLRNWRAGREAQAPALPNSQSHQYSIAILSGPEGGITQDELTSASEHGIIPVSLGPRILRAETAPIAAVSALMYELEL